MFFFYLFFFASATLRVWEEGRGSIGMDESHVRIEKSHFKISKCIFFALLCAKKKNEG